MGPYVEHGKLFLSYSMTPVMLKSLCNWQLDRVFHMGQDWLDLYDVFYGGRYLLKSGCQWRMLPSDFPKWRSVHSYFEIWSEEKEGKESILDQALKKIVGKVRTDNGRKEKTSMAIVDAQSVKNTDTAEEKGYDGGKKSLESNVI